MAFRRLMTAMGVGGPSVETVLASPTCRPGGTIEGEIHVVGGDHPVDITHVALALLTRVEVASGASDYDIHQEFQRQRVTEAFQLDGGQRRDVPFRLELPWETPVTEAYGEHLPGMTVGVRTDLKVAGALDEGDLDAVGVYPTPAQEQILDALLRLGFRLTRADVQRGHIYGVRQTLPFYQEIEFFPAPQYARAIDQLVMTFIAGPRDLEIVLEIDKRGGVLAPGGDAFGRFTVETGRAEQTDWTAQLDGWLRESSHKRGLLF